MLWLAMLTVAVLVAAYVISHRGLYVIDEPGTRACVVMRRHPFGRPTFVKRFESRRDAENFLTKKAAPPGG